MNKSKLFAGLCAVAFTSLTTTANATLMGRLPLTPGGMDYQAAYDDVLDITWTTNANLAASNTFGLPTGTDLGVYMSDPTGYTGEINANGLMNWPGAQFWIDAVNASNYLGFNDWRLVSMSVAAGLPYGVAEIVVDCSEAATTEAACRDSELGYMFYQNMGGTLGFSQAGDQTVNGVLLSNVQPNPYWTGTEDLTGVVNQRTDTTWFIDYVDGSLDTEDQRFLFDGFSAWAVRPGDVTAAPMPEPPMVFLFAAGLVGLLGVKNRMRLTR